MFGIKIKPLGRSLQRMALVGMLSLGGAVASANTIHIYNAPLTPGQEAVVELRMVPTPDVAGIEVKLLYDPNTMEAVDPALTGREGFEVQGALTEGRGSYVTNYRPVVPEGGKKGVNFVWADVRGIEATGLVARLIFRAKDNLASGAQTNLTLDPGPEGFLLSNGKAVTVPSVAVFHAPDDPYAPGLAGDVNRDGQISIDDVVAALKFTVGLGVDPTPEQVAAGDVTDGDGIVTVRDVTRLLQNVAGLTPDGEIL